MYRVIIWSKEKELLGLQFDGEDAGNLKGTRIDLRGSEEVLASVSHDISFVTCIINHCRFTSLQEQKHILTNSVSRFIEIRSSLYFLLSW